MHPHRILRTARRCGLLATSLLLAQCALAQPEGGALPHRPVRFDGPLIAGAPLGHETVVQGAPYCADAVHESVQTLADGNRIVQRQVSRQCRDAQGRTRQEVASGPRRNVYLRDPVAQEAWLLDPVGRRATRLGGGSPLELGERGAGWEQRLADWRREMREWGREMKGWGRDWGREVRDRLRTHPPAPPQPPQPPGPPAATLDLPPLAVRIVVDGVELAGLPPPPPGLEGLPPAVAFQARVRAPRGPGVVTPLPPQTLEGVRADGQRTTWTVEAGRIGNEKPIVRTREVWTSPELMITLLSRDVDPLAGEDSYRVQNLVRGEPDPALFRVPAEYRKVISPGKAAP